MSRANVWAYRISGGRIGARFRRGAPVLLLTTVGRKSGAPRTAPLLYLRDEPLRGLELWHVADPLEDGERPVRPERGRRSRSRERDEAVPGALDEQGGRRDATDHRVDLTAARQREDDRARGLEERLVAP